MENDLTAASRSTTLSNLDLSVHVGYFATNFQSNNPEQIEPPTECDMDNLLDEILNTMCSDSELQSDTESCVATHEDNTQLSPGTSVKRKRCPAVKSSPPFLYEQNPDDESDEEIKEQIKHAIRCRNQRVKKAENMKAAKIEIESWKKRFANLRRRFVKARKYRSKLRVLTATSRREISCLKQKNEDLRKENDDLRKHFTETNHQNFESVVFEIAFPNGQTFYAV